MIVQPGRMLDLTAAGKPRRAAVTVWTLLVLTTLLAAMALGLNAAWLANAHQELRVSADAVALAAARELVADEWLRTGSAGLPALITAAETQAGAYAALNRVLGVPIDLRIDASLQSDLVFGSIDPLAPGTLIPVDRDHPASWTPETLDAVLVTTRRLRSRGQGVPLLLGALLARPAQDLQTAAIVRLDRDVYGFQARGGTPLPLVPFGVRSDPTGTDARSWEHQVRDRHGPDDLTVDPVSGAVTAGADGIPEIDVDLQLPPSGAPALSNGYLLTLGSGLTETQLTAGVTADDLIATAGRIALDASQQLLLPGSPLGPADASAALLALTDALDLLLQSGTPRVWPLVSGYAIGPGEATVTAFVAARLVRVEAPGGGPLRLRLQPAQLVVPQALTDPARRGVAAFVPSPYLARLRLAR